MKRTEEFLRECEFVVESTGEGFEFKKMVEHEGKIRIVLEPES
jgi:hypothetical protein